MEPLFEALYTYAYKYRFDAYALRDKEEWLENEKMIRIAEDELNACGMNDAVGRIEDGYSTLACLDRRSAFWAGLSIGLELGRL